MSKIGEEIVAKGETLRNLYLLREIGEEIGEVFADGINIKKSLSPLFERAEKLIPLLERELPDWAKEIAKNTYDTRNGFVIWEEK